MNFQVRAVLLDIEGTVAPVDFVHKKMFPYVLNALDLFLQEAWETDELGEVLALLAADAGNSSVVEWLPTSSESQQQTFVAHHVRELMATDQKLTGLKQLQGHIWKDGFDNGQLQAPLYPDVVPALTAWKNLGLELHIYSSGSVAAQKLFFGHTTEGDCLHLLSNHYDTKVGGKKEVASYQAILTDLNRQSNQPIRPEDLLFLSDIPEELAAAQGAGLQAGLALRPGNTPVEQDHPFYEVSTFDTLTLSLPSSS
ncbi:MAG: acireductone synthase [Pirellulaceae bacterium]|nr:acireductone synthase [Pirellulaceae bacterium]